MEQCFSWQGTVLTTGESKTKFLYPIRQVGLFKNKIIVLLEIPFDDTVINNLYAVSKKGEILWQSQDLNQVYKGQVLLPYEQMVIGDTEIKASDFYGRQYIINGDTGQIMKREITK